MEGGRYAEVAERLPNKPASISTDPHYRSEEAKAASAGRPLNPSPKSPVNTDRKPLKPNRKPETLVSSGLMLLHLPRDHRLQGSAIA